MTISNRSLASPQRQHLDHVPPKADPFSLSLSAHLLPKQHPPSPAVENPEVLLVHVLDAVLDLRDESLQPPRDGPRDPQRHLALEHVQDGEHEEGHGREAGREAVAVGRVQDARDEGLALPERVLRVVGRHPVVGRAAEDSAHGGDDGGPF